MSQGVAILDIVYHPIGVVRCPIAESLRPEVIRAEVSWLMLEACLVPAVDTLQVGQNLWVLYHMHRVEGCHDAHLPDLFTRRVACRPNPIGVTLTRIVAVDGAAIAVAGLDAIDGSPILDIKPYKPVFDAPPVHPAERVR